jgi:pimeloyl-ACP methyl ester carboxylesterase
MLLKRPWIALLALLLLAAIVVAIVLIVSGSSSAKHAGSSQALIDVPVQFTVTDENRSLLHCSTTGRTYQVAGRLVAPASGPQSAATLYLHGVILPGSFEWHFDGVPGYDYARELAKLGHTSVVVDRVGYGKTVPRPQLGAQACLGAQADETHQIITQMRSGRYSVLGSSGTHPKAFTRVGLAGYSIGAVIGELEAGSFGDVVALVVVSFADQGMTNYGTPFPEVARLCAPGSPKPPGGINGYFPTLPLAKLPPLVSRQADPRVVAAMTQSAELDPCGDLLTGAQWFNGLATTARARVKAPVLVIHGIFDVLFHGFAWRQEYDHFTGTRDKTLIGIPDGQLVMLDRHVDTFRRDTAHWLGMRGL